MVSAVENGVVFVNRCNISLVSASWSYAASQLRGEGTGRAEETVLTNERVINSVGEVATSMEVKRWISMRWLTKWAPSWKGQQVEQAAAKVEGVAVRGIAWRRMDGAE